MKGEFFALAVGLWWCLIIIDADEPLRWKISWKIQKYFRGGKQTDYSRLFLIITTKIKRAVSHLDFLHAFWKLSRDSKHIWHRAWQSVGPNLVRTAKAPSHPQVGVYCQVKYHMSWIYSPAVLWVIYEGIDHAWYGWITHTPHHDLQLHPRHTQMLPWFLDQELEP